MYLISAYFDDAATFKIQQYIDRIAKKTGNPFMQDNNVSPHITISSFQTRQEKQMTGFLAHKMKGQRKGNIQWVSIGTFFPHVIYLTPVRNKYLHTLSLEIYECLTQVEDITINSCYQPFSWLPHTTIGKTLTNDEMQEAFQVLQNEFDHFPGRL